MDGVNRMLFDMGQSDALSFTFKQIWIMNELKEVQLTSFCDNVSEVPLSLIFLH